MKRILVRAPNWIGDQVMAYPFFRYLRQQHPNAWIAVVCTEWVRDVQFRGFIDEVYVISRTKQDHLFTKFYKILDLSRKLRDNGPWDLSITLPNSFGSALLMYGAGVNVRRGYNTDARGFLLNQKIAWNPDPSIHRVDAFGALLHSHEPGFSLRDYWSKSGESQFDPIKHWPEVQALEPPTALYAVIAPGAIADSRRWSVAQFAELIEMIHEQYGLTSVIVGGQSEKEIAESFRKRDLPVIDFTAQGPVASLWKVFKKAKFTVSNESGLAHVAALCGSPVQIVCGAADPKRTEPIGPGKVRVKFNPIECWPCERNICQFEGELKNRCLNEITPQSLVEGW